MRSVRIIIDLKNGNILTAAYIAHRLSLYVCPRDSVGNACASVFTSENHAAYRNITCAAMMYKSTKNVPSGTLFVKTGRTLQILQPLF